MNIRSLLKKSRWFTEKQRIGWRDSQAHAAYKTRRAFFEPLEDRRLLAVFHLHPGVVDGATGSLRAAIDIANSNNSVDIINLAAGTYELTLAGRDEDANATGDLDIRKDGGGQTLIIRGEDGTTIDARSIDRVLQVQDGAVVIIDNVTITNGRVTEQFGRGGGLLNEGVTRLKNVGVISNEAPSGGGIYSTSPSKLPIDLIELEIENSSISGNTSVFEGAAIAMNGKVKITDSIIVNNETSSDGFDRSIIGAGGSGAELTLTNVQIRDNTVAGSAVDHGLIDIGTDATLSATNIQLHQNVMNGGEGAFVRVDGGHASINQLTMKDPTWSGTGAAFEVSSSGTLDVRQSQVSNTASAGIIRVESGAFAEFTNFLMSDNLVVEGFPIAVKSGGGARFIHSTLTGTENPNETSSPFFIDTKANLQFRNSIVWETEYFILPDYAGVLEISDSIIRNDYPGGGNLVEDPQFFDARNGDYRLKETSPAIDMVSGGPAIALDGQVRPRDYSPPTGNSIQSDSTRLPAAYTTVQDLKLAGGLLSAQELNSTVTNVVNLRDRDLAEVDANQLPSVQRITHFGSFAQVELTDDQFAALEASGAQFESVDNFGTISVGPFDFDPVRDGEPAGLFADQLGTSTNSDGDGLYFVQLRNTPQDDQIDQLRAVASVVSYYPLNTYLVWGSRVGLSAFADDPLVRWIGEYHRGFRNTDDVVARFEGLADGATITLDVALWDDGRLDEIEAYIATHGGRVVFKDEDAPVTTWMVEATKSAAQGLANIPNVIRFAATPTFETNDESSSLILVGEHNGKVINSNARYRDWLEATDYDGTGVKVSIVDSGVDWDHPDLNVVSGTEFGPGYSEEFEPGSDGGGTGSGHGTHVAGIVAGTGASGITDENGFLYGLGVAPGVQLHAIDNIETGSRAPTTKVIRASIESGAALGNNSWGSDAPGSYTSLTKAYDLGALDANGINEKQRDPFLMVFAAGNDGCKTIDLFGLGELCKVQATSSIGDPAQAKNVLTVGNSSSARTGKLLFGDTLNDLAPSSSLGNTFDGRIKPDVVAPGSDIVSAKNGDGTTKACIPTPSESAQHAFCTGTSMAAPQVAGVAALFTEFWQRRTRSIENPKGDIPEPATVKAAIIGTTDDMAGGSDGTAEGVLASRPNNKQGWGLVNSDRLLDPQVPVEYFENPVILTDVGSTWETTVTVVDPTEPLRFTLVWSDAPAAEGAGKALMNDLDLEIGGANGLTIGNNFSNGWSQTDTTQRFDRLNNVESVWIENPPAGEYTVTVKAHALNGDAWLFDGDETDQHFSLVAYNAHRSGERLFDAGAYEFPPVLVVNDTGSGDDEDLSNGTTTLREAINVANRIPGDDMITFNLPVNRVHEIDLGGAELQVVDGLTIAGPGADQLYLDGGTLSRIFNATADLTLRGMTLASGGTTGDGGAIYINGGDLNLTEVQILDSKADLDGGGIYAQSSSVVIDSSTVAFNESLESGGGIHLLNGDLTLRSSTISQNTSDKEGGGIYVARSSADIFDSTIAHNLAISGVGGGINSSDASAITLQRTIVAGNLRDQNPHDVFGDLEPGSSYNLIADAKSAGGLNNGTNNNIIGADPASVIGPFLENRGGPTLVHALVPPPLGGSNAAIDAIPTSVMDLPDEDQRGAARPEGRKLDIGAYEFTDAALIVNTLDDLDDGTSSTATLSLRKAIRLANERFGHNEIRFDLPSGPQLVEVLGSALVIKDHVTIVGRGADVLTIDGLGNDSVFRIERDFGDPLPEVAMSAMTITGGHAVNKGAGIDNDGGNLTLLGVHITRNVSDGTGGGLANSGTTFVINSTISENTADLGGGISNPGGFITLTNSTVANNTAEGAGGGIYSRDLGRVTLESSTVAFNRANNERSNEGNNGGGIVISDFGRLTLSNSIVAGNSTFLPVESFVPQSNILVISGTLESHGNNLIEFDVRMSQDSTSGRRYWYTFNAKGWAEADKYAKQSGGYLAAINSQAENDYVQRFIGNRPIWIGGRQQSAASEPGTGWQWESGESFEFTNWSSNEPDDRDPHDRADADYLTMYEDGTWRDSTDEYHLGYLIEFGFLDPTDQVIRYDRLFSPTGIRPLGDYGGPVPTVALASGSSAIDAGEIPPVESAFADYRLDERSGQSAADSSDGGHHATLVGGTDPTVAGVVLDDGGSALGFNGIDGHVALPAAVADFSQTGFIGFSFEAWVYPTATNAHERIFDFGNGAAADNIILNRSSTTDDLVLHVFSGSEISAVFAPGAIEQNRWQHFAVTIDISGNAKIFKNGTEIASGPLRVPAGVSRSRNFLGRSNFSDPFFAGRMDRVSIYHTALSSKDIFRSFASTFVPEGDQRGFPRQLDGNNDGSVQRDIGAFEFELRELELTVNRSVVSEGRTIRGTLTRTGDLSSEVDVALSSSDSDQASVPATVAFAIGQSSLSFDIMGIADAEVDGAQSVTITATATEYTGDDVSVSIEDDDLADFSIIDTDNSTIVDESGTTDTFDVVLDAKPVGNVVLQVSSSDTTEVTVNKAALTFTPDNWDVFQTIIVTGVDDEDIDGSQISLVSIQVDSTQTTAEFLEVARKVVAVRTTDNDDADFRVAESDGSTSVSEDGTSDTLLVVLDSQPLTDVVITVTSSNTDEADVDKPSLTFTNSNWNIAQTVTVTGVDDSDVDGAKSSLITLSVDQANSDNAYVAVVDKTISVTTIDNDTASLTVNIFDTSVSEGAGAEATMATVSRTGDTTNALTVNLSSSDIGEATVPSTVTIPAGQSTSAAFSITAIDDTEIDGTQTATISASASAYIGGQASLDVTDDDRATLTLAIASNVISENGTTTATVSRNSDTTNALAVTLSTSDSSEATVPSTVTIAAGQTTSATFTITGVSDLIVDGTQSVAITAAATSHVDGTDTLDVTDDDGSAISLPTGETHVTNENGTIFVRNNGTILFQALRSDASELVFVGGSGDETLSVGDLGLQDGVPIKVSFDGKAGNDTYRLMEASQTLDLATSANGKLQNVETINIDGSGENSLALRLADIQSVAPNGVFRVQHDDGDTVAYGEGWMVDIPQVIGGQFVHIMPQADVTLQVSNNRAWQNPLLRLDVNRDGAVSPLDALVVINTLNSIGPRELVTPTSMSGVSEFFYFDSSGDRSVSPLDVLLVINFLNDPQGGGEGESSLFESAIPPLTQTAVLHEASLKHNRPRDPLNSLTRNNVFAALASEKSEHNRHVEPTLNPTSAVSEERRHVRQTLTDDSMDLESLIDELAKDTLSINF